MYTREQYLVGECTHDEYYVQIVRESNATQVVLGYFTVEELTEMYERDEYFNWMPERKYITRTILGTCSHCQYTWEFLAKQLCVYSWKKYGDGRTMAGAVCVLKCAARMIVKQITTGEQVK
jgi:hypothetical protein